jgi:hypothetical protein
VIRTLRPRLEAPLRRLRRWGSSSPILRPHFGSLMVSLLGGVNRVGLAFQTLVTLRTHGPSARDSRRGPLAHQSGKAESISEAAHGASHWVAETVFTESTQGKGACA